ncbi:GMC family oxidoreductase [Ilumatobacter sp.]|uniref:GMC family oxidoreductase n=1 Tax=Ilumatobacter sp. TaxID=1967498 RepID=UPI00329A38D6
MIGSGAAGITIARRLSRSGLRVTVLEAGGLRHDRKAEAGAFKFFPTGRPFDNPIPDRGRWFGGSTNLWFGRCTRPTAIDFDYRPWVPHSGWPISIEELEPWFGVASEILDVPHADKLRIEEWPSNPTIRAFCSEHSASALEVFLWAQAPAMGPAAKQQLSDAASVKVITDATCVGLTSVSHDQAEAASIIGPGGRRFSVRARTFVVAAGGLENPRLLLLSNDAQPNGLGNHHDNVGRYYLDHVRGAGLARVDVRPLDDSQLAVLQMLDEQADTPYGPAQLRVVFDQKTQHDEELLNHGLHGYLVSELEESSGFEAYLAVRAQLGRRTITDHRVFARQLAALAANSPQLARLRWNRLRSRNRPTSFVVIDQLEHAPDPESRISLRHRDLDRFGMARLEVDWRIGSSTLRSHRRLHEIFFDRLASVGIRQGVSEILGSPSFQPHYQDMKHPSGTTRMSSSPKDGVVDANCRVHGSKNVYVAGSSTFPTSGHFNPTLTIVALAARLSDHIERSFASPGTP